MNEFLNVGHAPEMDVIERYQSWDDKNQVNDYIFGSVGKIVLTY
jgi:lysyl-tRNA synthetase class II